MEIKNSDINFGSRILYPMKLKKFTDNKCKFLKADFAELSTNSIKDNFLISQLAKNWATTNRSNNYIHDIKTKFAEDALFFVKEFKYFITKFSSKNRKIADRTATIAVVHPENPNLLQLKFIQSAPEKQQKIAGGGECTLLGIVKYAKEKGYKKIELISTADKFYERLGFSVIPEKNATISDLPTHFLTSDKFDDFIKNLERKYNI